MPKNKTISVTPALLKSLADLKKSIVGLPAGEAKKKARAALKILSLAFGEKPAAAKRVSGCLAHTPMF